MCTAGYPEPYAFSRRVYERLRDRRAEFDLVHDNQCLGTGLLGFVRDGWPFVNTLHHPITVDRDLELDHATSIRGAGSRCAAGTASSACRCRSRGSCRATSRCRRTRARTSSPRWVSIPTRCTSCRSASTRRSSGRCRTSTRVPGRLMTTASADVPLKGLTYLIEALAKVRTERDDAHLVVIGQPRHKSAVPGADRAARPAGRDRVRERRQRRAHRRAVRRSRDRGDPVAVRRLLAARGRGDGVRRPARHHDRRRAARGRRPARRERDARAARRSRRARRADRRRC